MDFGRLQRGEFIGFVGVAILLASLWLPWFNTGDNPNATINGERQPGGPERGGPGGDFTAWETFTTLNWLLVAACAAPLILAWIVIRGHKLTWRPGEITMIVGMTAFALILLNGVILGKPGEPDAEISRRIGYFVGMLGAALICAGGVIRQAQGGRGRKPPGTL